MLNSSSTSNKALLLYGFEVWFVHGEVLFNIKQSSSTVWLWSLICARWGTVQHQTKLFYCMVLKFDLCTVRSSSTSNKALLLYGFEVWFVHGEVQFNIKQSSSTVWFWSLICARWGPVQHQTKLFYCMALKFDLCMVRSSSTSNKALLLYGFEVWFVHGEVQFNIKQSSSTAWFWSLICARWGPVQHQTKLFYCMALKFDLCTVRSSSTSNKALLLYGFEVWFVHGEVQFNIKQSSSTVWFWSLICARWGTVQHQTKLFYCMALKFDLCTVRYCSTSNKALLLYGFEVWFVHGEVQFNIKQSSSTVWLWSLICARWGTVQHQTKLFYCMALKFDLCTVRYCSTSNKALLLYGFEVWFVHGEVLFNIKQSSSTVWLWSLICARWGPVQHQTKLFYCMALKFDLCTVRSSSTSNKALLLYGFEVWFVHGEVQFNIKQSSSTVWLWSLICARWGTVQHQTKLFYCMALKFDLCTVRYCSTSNKALLLYGFEVWFVHGEVQFNIKQSSSTVWLWSLICARWGPVQLQTKLFYCMVLKFDLCTVRYSSTSNKALLLYGFEVWFVHGEVQFNFKQSSSTVWFWSLICARWGTVQHQTKLFYCMALKFDLCTVRYCSTSNKALLLYGFEVWFVHGEVLFNIKQSSSTVWLWSLICARWGPVQHQTKLFYCMALKFDLCTVRSSSTSNKALLLYGFEVWFVHGEVQFNIKQSSSTVWLWSLICARWGTVQHQTKLFYCMALKFDLCTVRYCSTSNKALLLYGFEVWFVHGEVQFNIKQSSSTVWLWSLICARWGGPHRAQIKLQSHTVEELCLMLNWTSPCTNQTSKPYSRRALFDVEQYLTVHKSNFKAIQ